jgi:hypothetical protein
MPSRSVPREKQADVEQLAREIREAVDFEISELADVFAPPADMHDDLLDDASEDLLAVLRRSSPESLRDDILDPRQGLWCL